jgi:hypothetical protein
MDAPPQQFLGHMHLPIDLFLGHFQLSTDRRTRLALQPCPNNCLSHLAEAPEAFAERRV